MNTTRDIVNINTLFAPFGLRVTDVVTGAQNIKYKIALPLDLNTQGKVKRAENNIRFALSTALNTNDYSYGHDTDCVYIERRNDDFEVVKFGLFAEQMHTNKLMVALGKDENGQKVVTDLAKAPHMLVGGTTGSGKSELLHCFVASLIEGMPYTHVSLYIIDPKRAEFSPYKNCKSIRVITEMNQAVDYLNRAVEVMEQRYSELERTGAKDIYQYTGTMYPIVIIIDELADLIMTYPQAEASIIRIAAKARACGIHLIIGTQSPRRDVVKGLIKSNIPTKIALHTSNQMESRIILDQGGAENLLGRGDMLFIENGSFTPVRIQSAYVDSTAKAALANKIAREPQTTQQQPVYYPLKKKGLFQGLKNIWNAPQTTTPAQFITIINKRP